jgi:hypothetical protein
MDTSALSSRCLFIRSVMTKDTGCLEGDVRWPDRPVSGHFTMTGVRSLQYDRSTEIWSNKGTVTKSGQPSKRTLRNLIAYQTEMRISIFSMSARHFSSGWIPGSCKWTCRLRSRNPHWFPLIFW